ncbi:MAG: GNAT family N-acetyltransferase [Tildeniella nuda ZEHNDER 1965/U140]|jgi:predicted GNAT family N-acyltransferase|nr:GNAT family N-acetyltransferase [Tildeniella nuda ZEHNDER 1965/U140]
MDNLVIKIADFSLDFPAIQHIRSLVFQIEQGVAADLEFDGKDETADHLLAYLDGQPVGTARMRRLNDRTAKVERVAVLKTARGSGIGKRIMVEALAFLTNAQVAEVLIHAQEAVRDFYQQLGFEPEGEVFREAGIPHVKMKKLLTSQIGR